MGRRRRGSWIGTGHTTSQMLNKCRRAARSMAELGQGTLAALDGRIPSCGPPLGTRLVAVREGSPCPTITPQMVGRPGLEPGTYGLKEAWIFHGDPELDSSPHQSPTNVQQEIDPAALAAELLEAQQA